MKLILSFLILTLSVLQLQGQVSLPIDFESGVTTADFTNFDGGGATVISNPYSTGLNTSSMVGRIIRNGGQPWAGAYLNLNAKVDFSTKNFVRMLVYTSAQVGTKITLKFEDMTNSGVFKEVSVFTTTNNAWEELMFDFTGAPMDYDRITFLFDHGNLGDSSANSTFYFDNIEQIISTPTNVLLDLPVTFEDSTEDYTMTDFGGNSSTVTADPTNSNNTVCKVLKTAVAETWAGTTIGTPAGFASNIPFSNTATKMTMKVWSPDAGIPVRLKVEDSNDPSHTCETEVMTTKAGQWEDLIWDFSNEVTGTKSLSDGLADGYVYNKASIFFDFGTPGDTTNPKTYYFDNVIFGDTPYVNLSIRNFTLENFSITPNPASVSWKINSSKENLKTITIFNIIGEEVYHKDLNSKIFDIPAETLPQGNYILSITTETEQGSLLLTRE